MPPLPLTTLLHTALPGLSHDSRAVVSALACFNGNPRSPDHVAALVGMRNRYQLARTLRREGLPPLRELAGWARVCYWLQETERDGTSLSRLARCDGLDPAVAYRLVHRTTGLHWSEARDAGLVLIARRLRDRYPPGMRELVPGRGCLTTRRKSAGGDAAASDAQAIEPCTRESMSPRPAHPRGHLAKRLSLTGSPFDVVATSNGIAWLTRSLAAAVECVRLRPLGLIGSIRTGAVPTRLALTASGLHAYVTNQFAENVGSLDLRRLRQVGTIPVAGNPLGAVLSLDGRILYVTTNVDRLQAIWLATGQVVASVQIPMACTSLLLHPAGTRLFVPTFRTGLILEVDARTLRTIRRFSVGGVVHELVCTPDGLRLYATNEDGWMDTIHLTTGKRESLHLGSMAHGLALSPDGAVLYVGLLRAGEVAVIDAQTRAVVATIPTGGKPRRIAFDATGRTALIANEDGWVDLVD